MRKFILILFLVVIVIIGWFFLSHNKSAEVGPRQPAIAVSKHSMAFNQSIDSIMNAYFTLSESLINWDSIHSKDEALFLQNRLKNLKLDDLQKDSSGIKETAITYLTDASSDLDTIKSNNLIVGQRRGYNALSENLYDFLRTVRYDHSKLYLQQCPMAFNEEEPGVWLSKTDSIRNPYMGLHHPHYGGGMIKCGETKDTLNFISLK